MTRQITVVALLAICFTEVGSVRQPLYAAENNRSTVQSRCGEHPIGRILSQGDRHFKAGDLLCKGDHLDVEKGSTVHVLCLLSGADLEFSGLDSNLASRCIGSSQAEVWGPCTQEDRGNCPDETKGPGNNNTPVVISPYGRKLLNGRPFLSWHAVPGATGYIVEVEGIGVHWHKTVKGTTLPYPAQKPAMRYGNAYKITILANKEQSSSTYTESAFNLLPATEAGQVLNIVKRINSLNIPKDEAAYLDLDSAYMSHNLLNETISTLETRIKEGSQTPGIYRVLGDRYLSAGLPDRAKSQYKIASELAEKSDNSIELAKALSGLELVDQYIQKLPAGAGERRRAVGKMY